MSTIIKLNPVLTVEQIDLREFEGFCSSRCYELNEMLYWPIYINVFRIKYFELETHVTEPNTLIWVDYQDEPIEVYESPEEIIRQINNI
jgi:hypothetical protein